MSGHPDRTDVSEPLLPTSNASVEAFPLSDTQLMISEEEDKHHVGCSTTAATLNLCNTIVGAGMMALPRVIADLGIAVAVLIMAIVYLLSYYSLGAITRAAEVTHKNSYASLVKLSFGHVWERLLQVAIVFNNGGVMIVYLNILGDTLADPKSGLLPHFIPNAGEMFWTSKPMVLLYLMLLVLLPCCCMSMQLLGHASGVSIATAFSFGALTIALAIVAAIKGQMSTIHILPPVEGHAWRLLERVLVSFPVTMTSYLCHFQILPLKKELHEYTQRKLLNVVNVSLATTTLLYATASLSGYFLFGDDTQDNVLKNFTGDFVKGLIGNLGGEVVSIVVQLTYVVVCALTYPLINWALRDTIRELCFSSDELTPQGFYGLTVILQAILLTCSIVAPSIYVILGIMGSTCGVLIAFFFPGLLILRVGPNANKRRRVTAAVVMILVGIILAAITILKPLMRTK